MYKKEIQFKYFLENGAVGQFTLEQIENGELSEFLNVNDNSPVKGKVQYTEYKDKNKTMLYHGDFVKGENNTYMITWNKNQTSWWLTPMDVNGDIFMFGFDAQSLGNGYFSRKDLEYIGNAIQNPEIAEKLDFNLKEYFPG